MFAIKKDMIVTGIAAGAGLLSAGLGVFKSRAAARRQRREMARQRAANDAWYTRNYYQDYLGTVEAQNALNRYRNAWAEQTQMARARQAVTGGTPEQAQAVAEAGGEAMGNVMGTLAANGQQNRQAIDAQKLAMDANLSNQAAALAEADQRAGMNLAMNGVNVATSALQGLEPKSEKVAAALATAPVVRPATTNTGVNAPTTVGKEAGINPDLIENPAEEEYQFYTKNPSVRY